MHVAPGVDGPRRGDQGLADHQPAEHALPTDLRAATAVQVAFELFQIEYRKEVRDGVGHEALRWPRECKQRGWRKSSAAPRSGWRCGQTWWLPGADLQALGLPS